MNILLLAPHPFYQNRGTPIAVDLLVKTLCEAGHTVDVLTFNEGDDRHYRGLQIYRVGRWLGMQNIRPGFSLKKLLLDALMIPHTATLLLRHRYDVIHAVEESAFIAWFFSLFTRKPFIYDMDSSLATQLTDKHQALKPVAGVLRWLESIPIKGARVVVPVCDALATIALEHRASGVHLLKDISMLDTSPLEQMPTGIQHQWVDFTTLFVPPGDQLAAHTTTPRSARPDNQFLRFCCYAGNLESYQGIDLMLESFAKAVETHADLALVIVGGNEADIAKYTHLAADLGIQERVKFLGPRPVALLKALCDQAHLLLSPRITGENTPMKLYSYLDSGVPVLATDLPTHTEVINTHMGYLASPDAGAFAAQLVAIFDDYESAKAKAEEARRFIASNHSLVAFQQRVLAIYAEVERAKAHR